MLLVLSSLTAQSLFLCRNRRLGSIPMPPVREEAPEARDRQAPEDQPPK